MRQYIASTDFDSSGLLAVSGKDYRYMRQVLRISVGDMVQVRTPAGRLQDATVARVLEGRKTVLLQVCGDDSLGKEGLSDSDGEALDSVGEESAPSCEIWLFQCVARPQKMDVIIRQATECGVAKIIPVANAFSQSGSSERNLRSERYQRIIKEARQQSGSPLATQVTETVTVEEAVEVWKAHQKELAAEGKESLGIVLYERNSKTKSLHQALGAVEETASCALFCGSEGGISPQEMDQLLDAGFTGVHFKTNILRCETAALYGIASLQCALTEKKIWQCRES